MKEKWVLLFFGAEVPIFRRRFLDDIVPLLLLILRQEGFFDVLFNYLAHTIQIALLQ